MITDIKDLCIAALNHNYIEFKNNDHFLKNREMIALLFAARHALADEDICAKIAINIGMTTNEVYDLGCELTDQMEKEGLSLWCQEE